MGYSAVTLKKIHALSSMAGMGHHNFRTLPSAAPNADMSRTQYNQILVNPNRRDYIELWKERQYEVNMAGGYCKPRPQQVLAYEALLTVSKDSIAPENIDAWAQESVNWLKQTFGEENVLSAVLHLDETTPHIHAVIIPIDERNRLCAFSFTGKKSQLQEMQTTYAKAMKPFGLERGEEYAKGKFVGDNIKDFYRRIEKISHLEQPKPIENEPTEEYLARVDEFMKTELSKSYDREKKWKRKFVESDAIHGQVYDAYEDAIKLFDVLFARCHGDKKLVHKELENLMQFIDQAPLQTIDTSISYMADKFAKGENLETFIPEEKYKKTSKEHESKNELE